MRRILARFITPLRNLPSVTIYSANRNRNNLSASSTPSASLFHAMKGASTAALFLPAVLSDAKLHLPQSVSLPRNDPWDDLQIMYATRDLPQLIVNAVTNVYNSASSAVQRRADSHGANTITFITATNIAVYALWKVAPSGVMVRHFANSLEAMRRGRVWTTFTSNFSHMGIFHLGTNMYLLNRFGPEVADIIGRDRFLLFYGTAGVASSLASLAFRRFTRSNVLSLGASGAVVSTLWLYACFFPDRRMSLIGTETSMSMQELVLAYAVIDAAGLLGSLGKIDFAAHLGGALFGNCWFYLVRDKLAREVAERQRGRQTGRLASLGAIFREGEKKK